MNKIYEKRLVTYFDHVSIKMHIKYLMNKILKTNLKYLTKICNKNCLYNIF